MLEYPMQISQHRVYKTISICNPLSVVIYLTQMKHNLVLCDHADKLIDFSVTEVDRVSLP